MFFLQAFTGRKISKKHKKHLTAKLYICMVVACCSFQTTFLSQATTRASIKVLQYQI